MKNQVVRAGKYFSVGMLLIASLPVLVPLLFFLSIFGFAFVLPLGCALAGFIYLRKYAGMLYRKLPISIGACAPWGRRRPLPAGRPHPPLFTDFPLGNQQAIETSDLIDPEFDAVLVSTAPRESEQRSVAGDESPDVGSGPGAISFDAVSAEDTTRAEGDNAVEEKDHQTIGENRINRERTGDDKSADESTRIEGAEDEIPAEKWTTEERTDVSTLAEDGARKGETGDYITPEFGAIVLGEDDISTDDGTKGERIDGDICDEDAKSIAGFYEGTSGDDTSRGVKEDKFATDWTETQKRKGEFVDETRGLVPEVDTAANHGTGVEGKDSASIDDGTRRERKYKEGGAQEEQDEDENETEKLNEERTSSTMPVAVSKEKSFEVPEDFDRISGNKEIEKKIEQDEVQPKPDDTTLPEVPEQEERRSPSSSRRKGDEMLSEEIKEQESEVVRNEDVLGASEEDLSRKLSLSAAAEITPKEGSKEGEIRSLRPHQANEDDIWICKDCGWKYPNARPSAKIRRNHKKHCEGSSPTASASDDGIDAEKPSQHDVGFANLRLDSKSSLPLADSRPEQFGVGLNEWNETPESDVERGKVLSAEPGPAVDGSSAVGEKGRSPSLAEDDVMSSDQQHHLKGEEFETTGAASFAPKSGEHDDEEIGDSFRTAADDFALDRWSSLPCGGQDDDEQDQVAKVSRQAHQELELSEDLNAVKGVVGDKHVSTGLLLRDIEDLSQLLGIDLPARSPDLPDIDWAKLAIEVMKVVVGVD